MKILSLDNEVLTRFWIQTPDTDLIHLCRGLCLQVSLFANRLLSAHNCVLMPVSCTEWFSWWNTQSW